MRRPAIISILILASALRVLASDGAEFRRSALAAIRNAAPGASAERIQLLATPDVDSRFRGVAVSKASYDQALGRWQLQLECIPRIACVPSVAIVSSPDEKLFRSQRRVHPQLLVRAGERKQLIATAGPIRIQTEVVCLQSGGIGDRIRVREPRGRRLLVATVEHDGSLRVGGAQ